MSKHTPGPWVVDESHHYGSINNAVLTRHIAMVSQYCSVTGDQEENAANARLIAAAPELLEALEASNTLLRIKRHACENPEVCRVPDVHVERNSAAIAKARGAA